MTDADRVALLLLDQAANDDELARMCALGYVRPKLARWSVVEDDGYLVTRHAGRLMSMYASSWHAPWFRSALFWIYHLRQRGVSFRICDPLEWWLADLSSRRR